jgi:hypothetical protein
MKGHEYINGVALMTRIQQIKIKEIHDKNI